MRINKSNCEKYLEYCRLISECQQELNIKIFILKTNINYNQLGNTRISKNTKNFLIKEREEYIHLLKITIRLLQRGLTELVNNKAMDDYCYLNVPYKNSTPKTLAMAVKRMEERIYYKMNKPAKKIAGLLFI